MTILEGDIQVMASQVLDDVPEGGGAATGNVIVDGQSNNLLPDVSELDRVYGRVQVRKVFPSVRTANTDRYSGANVVVIDPPDDPAVSIVLFDTADSFDTRDAAVSRIEAYLALGPEYRGLLFGNHIAGQMNVSLIQRTGTPMPSIGETIVLRKSEGLSTQFDQYVRVTDVESGVYTFEDGVGEFERLVVTLSISDQLLQDFPGFGAVRQDASVNYAGKSHVYNTIVADAARYYGVTKLENPITLGSFSAQVEDIYAQLVPSSRTETAIADARMNQQIDGLARAGNGITFTTSALALGPTANLYVGGGIMPGTLTITSALGLTLNDLGGNLMNGAVVVGAVDYMTGLVTASTVVTSGTITVNYTPASAPPLVSESLEIPVTAANQRLTYSIPLTPVPAPGSLQVSYLTQGRWYTLTDDGSGALRGSDSSLGAGTINFTTGSVVLTLGAMPDVNSSVIYLWAPTVNTDPVSASTDLALGGRFSHFEAFGLGAKPGTVSVTWTDGGSKTATDNGAGVLTGDATGRVFYSKGYLYVSPNVLPAPGTSMNVAITEATVVTQDVASFTNGGSSWDASLPTPLRAGSVELSVVAQFPVRVYPGVDKSPTQLIRIFDDGAGLLRTQAASGPITVGSINYGTGAVSLNKTTAAFTSIQGIWAARSVLGEDVNVAYTGQETRSLTLTLLNGGLVELVQPSWAWWSGAQANAAKARYSGADGSVRNIPFLFDDILVEGTVSMLEKPPVGMLSTDAITYASNSGIPGEFNPAATGYLDVRFTLGGETFVSRPGVSEIDIIRAPSPATGEGALAGSMQSYSRTVTLTSWPTGASPLVGRFDSRAASPLDGDTTNALVDRVTFRTATAPVAPNGFTLVGTFPDGTIFNVVADDDGFVNSGGVFAKIDYQTGIVRAAFGATTTDALGTAGVIDISSWGITGVTRIKLRLVRAESLRYNAVAYTYIPLSADILGLNPVRLPADGRVPIFRPGVVAVVHNTQTTAPATAVNGGSVNVGRVRLSRVRVLGNNGAPIESGWTANKNSGVVTYNDVTGWSQPVRVEHRIEDMALVSDAQISGLLRFTRAISHDYPAGTSYVSSALLLGDMRARVAKVFDQSTWTGVWSDDPIGSSATGTYDTINYPPEIENLGAVDERWYLVFTSTSSFNIVGEHFGVVGAGNTSTGASPLNPATATPYFTLLPGGFGIGWAIGNVIRINTFGAIKPVWIARVVQQSDPTVLSDSFTLAVRGDVDTP